jgi:TolB-like protein/class 3 adenylate cyclase/Flp pilus assembly protein TadD
MSDEPAEHPTTSIEVFSVAGWQVDASTHRISKDGQSIKLEPRTVAVLVYLAGRPGKAVTREELEREVWRGVVVGYDALNNIIAKLRKAFGDDTKRPRVIETIPKVGYRLIADVSVSPPPTSDRLETAHDDLERKLAAILYADVAGYSRLTGEDEAGTHRALRACLDIITASIERYAGNVVHFAGDAVLADFATLTNAMSCAVAVQQELAARNQDVPDGRRVQFRIGVNLGEVIVDRDDIYGDGVNVAARLESLAEPGGVCISGAVFDAIGQKLPLEYQFLGEQSVKNIAKPVRAYHARLAASATLPAPPPVRPKRKRPRRQAVAIAAALAVLLAGLGAYLWLEPPEPADDLPTSEPVAAVSPGMPSIAVLPFTNLSDHPAQEFFADGMTDGLITDLSKLSGMLVIARHSVFTYKDRAVKVKQIAEELGARYVVEGSVQRAGEQIRVNTQLIDTSTGSHLWAERFDGSATEIFTFQDLVIRNIVSALAVELSDKEKNRLDRRPTDNLEAYDYYLRAERRRLNSRDIQGHRTAIPLYREAIALDPRFAEAYAGIAKLAYDAWRWDADEVMSGPVARKLAYESASKVLELDAENPAAYGVLANLQVTDGRHEIAVESASKAVSFAPNDAEAYEYLARVLVYAGRHDEALEAMETAFRLNPKPSHFSHGYMGWLLFFHRRYDEAIEHLEKAAEEDFFREEYLAMAYAELGRVADAEAAVEFVFRDIPFANLAYFRVLNAHYKRKEDLELIIGALAKAGVPAWPYGYDPGNNERLTGDALHDLTFGRNWLGRDAEGAEFYQQSTDDGRIAMRTRGMLLVGTVRIKGDQLCVELPAAVLGRHDCGYVYRNSEGTLEEHNEYVRVTLRSIYHFSPEP